MFVLSSALPLSHACAHRCVQFGTRGRAGGLRAESWESQSRSTVNLIVSSVSWLIAFFGYFRSAYPQATPLDISLDGLYGLWRVDRPPFSVKNNDVYRWPKWETTYLRLRRCRLPDVLYFSRGKLINVICRKLVLLCHH